LANASQKGKQQTMKAIASTKLAVSNTYLLQDEALSRVERVRWRLTFFDCANEPRVKAWQCGIEEKNGGETKKAFKSWGVAKNGQIFGAPKPLAQKV
jgi:hypothetical protein